MVATCEHNLKLKDLNAKLFVYYWGHFGQQQGTYANVFNPVQNRILMAHQLILFRICESFLKSTKMHLK